MKKAIMHKGKKNACCEKCASCIIVRGLSRNVWGCDYKMDAGEGLVCIRYTPHDGRIKTKKEMQEASYMFKRMFILPISEGGYGYRNWWVY